MRANELRKLLKQQPFEPVCLGLSDGRSVTVRHPDQVVVAEQHLLVGLAKIERSRPMATPSASDAIAKDWLIVNLLHIASIEPASGPNGKARKRTKPM